VRESTFCQNINDSSFLSAVVTAVAVAAVVGDFVVFEKAFSRHLAEDVMPASPFHTHALSHSDTHTHTFTQHRYTLRTLLKYAVITIKVSFPICRTLIKCVDPQIAK